MIDKKSEVPTTHINPLVEQTFSVMLKQLYCLNFGCVTTSTYYVGLPQAHCKRCGKMTHYADKKICDPWEKPDD